MFVSDMERKTLAFTPSLLLFSFHLRGAPFGSSKACHCLLLLSCLLLSSVNTLHNLPEYDSFGSNIAASKMFQTFNGGNLESVRVPIHKVCHSPHLFSSLSALGSEIKFDRNAPFFGMSCPSKSWSNSALISNNLSDVVWLSLEPFTGFFHMGDTITCYKPLSEELYAKKNTRDSVPGKQCGGDSIKFLFFYQTQLSWASGVALLIVPMKATTPVLVLNLCNRPPVFWVRTKKFLIAVLIAAALLILIFCFNDENNQRNNYSGHIAVEKVEKPSTITISSEMDSLLRSISKETLQGSKEVSEDSMKPLASISSSSQAETSEALNLTVKTAKDKKRRRNKKKKKKGAISGLTSERTDVSSSHSGNSTPSSPLSPGPPTSQTSKKAVKPTKPALSHSATFPVYGVKSVIIQGSSLAPNVRAPGAKSRTQVKEEEEYRYDIWGDHLAGLNLMDRFKEVREGKSSSCFVGDESESFFVKGPQNLLTDSHACFCKFLQPMGLIKK